MFISLQSIFIIVLLNLFIIGIKVLSIKYLFKFNILIYNSKLNTSSNFSIACIIGLLLFCILSNLILLTPSLLFFLNHSLRNFEHIINFSIYSLKLIFLAISFLGFLDLLNTFKTKGNKFVNNFSKDLLISLCLSTLIYLLFSPKSTSSGIVFDTGLYHLPFINHLSKFTIEPGLANLHFRYGFYGLPFFGQVPLQTFRNSNYISPSINIGFMAIYFSYFLYFIKKINLNNCSRLFKGKLIFEEKIEDISILFFFLSIIFYTGGIFKSLSSYSLDLPLFICGSLTFHLILISNFDKSKINYYIPVFWLSFFSPIIKLTGIITPIFVILYIGLDQLTYLIKISNYQSFLSIIKNLPLAIIYRVKYLYIKRPQINSKLTISLIFIIFLIFLLTNIIITGYPFFPKDFLGPFHNYSLENNFLNQLRINTLNWHRYQNRPDISGNWLLTYFRTRNGLLNIIFWIVPTLLSSTLLIATTSNYKKFQRRINLPNLFICIVIIKFICFSYFIPLVNYYPWIPHCSIFILLILIYRLNLIKKKLNFIRIISYLLIIFVVLNSLFSISNYKILTNIPKSIFKEPVLINPKFNYLEIKQKKWVQLKNYHSNQNIKINVPEKGNQCWGITPPCTSAKNLIK